MATLLIKGAVMNKENAKDYLPLVQALAEGKTIQRFSNGEGWDDVVNPEFYKPAELYRIKPEPKKGWYRVCLSKEGVFASSCEDQDAFFEKQKGFIRWITGRVEYELPEGSG